MNIHCDGCGALLLRVDHRGRCWYCGTPSPDVRQYPVAPELDFTMSLAPSQWQRGTITVTHMPDDVWEEQEKRLARYV